ncbi:NAD(P)/FAD-dependent oxidoreductase [Dactylosporangium sp. CA-139066]|uniref:NAD(P)/FAD-dependent oxidoreductase n=1 Tax=Dactylosporangium sp. CA-139066 TaxID=3239930 RepID=UPI003D8FDC4D
MRIVMVGGGVIALLTAVQCVSAGHEVTVVDQGDIPNPAAGSFDRQRVVRALHLGDAAATAAAARALALWPGAGAGLFRRTGALTVLPDADLPRAQAALAGVGAASAVLGPAELAARFAHLRFPEGASAVLEAGAGIVLADRALAAFADRLRAHPFAELLPHRRVDAVRGTAVHLAGGEVLRADAVLVAAGAWSRPLLPPKLAAELVLHRQSQLHCRVPPADAPAWASTPTVPSLGTVGGAWLVVPVAGTPLKLSASAACRVVSTLDGQETPEPWRRRLLDLHAPAIPGLSEDWVLEARDSYYLTHAPTGGPLTVPIGERVLAHAACGGSSFKFAPLIAQSLAARLTGAARPTALRGVS